MNKSLLTCLSALCMRPGGGYLGGAGWWTGCLGKLLSLSIPLLHHLWNSPFRILVRNTGVNRYKVSEQQLVFHCEWWWWYIMRMIFDSFWIPELCWKLVETIDVLLWWHPLNHVCDNSLSLKLVVMVMRVCWVFKLVCFRCSMKAVFCLQ